MCKIRLHCHFYTKIIKFYRILEIKYLYIYSRDMCHIEEQEDLRTKYGIDLLTHTHTHTHSFHIDSITLMSHRSFY